MRNMRQTCPEHVFRSASRSQIFSSTGANTGEGQVDRSADHEVRPSRRDPPRNAIPPLGPASYRNVPDSRLPSSSLFPLPARNYSAFRPFEGPPYESRNARDRVNYALWPTYPTAQDTQTLLELWQFRRYTSPQAHTKSWGHVTRDCLPLDESELQKMVEKFRKKKVPVARAFASLTSYQQRQVHLLVLERYSYDQYRGLQWTLQAVETFPKKAKSTACESMQVIIERRLSPGALDVYTRGPINGLPPRLGPPNIDHEPMPQGPVPPPPMPAANRMPSRLESRPPGLVIANSQEPARNFQDPPAGPATPWYSRRPASGPRQVSFMSPDYSKDYDSHDDFEPVRGEYRRMPEWRSEKDVIDNRPPIHPYSGFVERMGDVSPSPPVIANHRELSYERDKREILEAEERARERKMRELQRLERSQGELRKRRGISKAPARSPSFERSRSRPSKSEPLQIRKKSSEDSVNDLISRWTN